MPIASESGNSNTTAVEGWNITTLKAYVDVLITSLEKETNLKFSGRDKALKHQFLLNQEHFRSLNNEASRLLTQQGTSVSRDMWETFQIGFRAWQADINGKIAQNLTRVEFGAYTTSTDKALHLGAGKWQGILQLITTISSLAAIIGVVFVIVTRN